MSATPYRSDEMTVTLRTHEDYRNACERIGQLEGIRPSAARDRLLEALRTAIHDYEPRQTPLRTSR